MIRLNIVAAHMARSHYKVKNVVARNFDPQYRSLFEAFNLQVVSATGWAAQRLEEMLYHTDLRTVFSAGNGEIELYEVTIPEGWNNQKLGKLIANQSCLAVSVTRAGRAFLPTTETILETGDVLLMSATWTGSQTIRSRFGLSQEEKLTCLSLVVGGGRTGSQLARVLLKQDHDVRVIDDRKDVLDRAFTANCRQKLFTKAIRST